MKPVDLRNATFAGLRQRLDGQRRDVYTAWVTHGPGTTREIAEKCGIDLLTLRPRTTELCEIGLVELWGSTRTSEGVYQAVKSDRWESWRKDIINSQMQLI